MKVTYTGIQKELPPKLQEKLDARFAKLSKLLEHRGEKEAHVVITTERHLHKAEITMPFYDHQLIGLGSDADLFTSMSEALEKLEKQAVKTRAKWREKRRRQHRAEEQPARKPAAKLNGKTAKSEARKSVRDFRVNHHDQPQADDAGRSRHRDESNDHDYLVYRDADKECVSVLVRRQDGHFDLIES